MAALAYRRLMAELLASCQIPSNNHFSAQKIWINLDSWRIILRVPEFKTLHNGESESVQNLQTEIPWTLSCSVYTLDSTVWTKSSKHFDREVFEKYFWLFSKLRTITFRIEKENIPFGAILYTILSLHFPHDFSQNSPRKNFWESKESHTFWIRCTTWRVILINLLAITICTHTFWYE